MAISNNRTISKEIYSTQDYSIFKKIDGNRPVLDSRVAKLVDSIKRCGFISSSPIVVNEKMEVIDGQHRLEACKRLNNRVFYTIEQGADVGIVMELNRSQSNWNSIDYVRSRAVHGSVPYKVLLDTIQQSKFTPRIAFLACTGKDSFTYHYKNESEFTVLEDKDIKENVAFFEKCMEISSKYQFLTAMFFCSKFVPKFALLEKVKNYRQKLLPFSSKEEAIETITHTYNYNLNQSSRVNFTALFNSLEQTQSHKKRTKTWFENRDKRFAELLASTEN